MIARDNRVRITKTPSIFHGELGTVVQVDPELVNGRQWYGVKLDKFEGETPYWFCNDSGGTEVVKL